MPDFDTRMPHIARIYDYWLGGKDNFAADREAAEQAMAVTPTIVPGVRANRRFLGRSVRCLAEAGVAQFLDIGTGIPTANNTHEVAQSVAPQARVVYVDNDPIVLSHARALLTSATAPTSYIDADARDTRKILHEAAQLLDLTQPVAVMLIAILHCIPDADDPYQLVSDLMDAVAPGSYLAITHPARDQLDVATRAEESLTQSMGQKVTFRSHEEVARFFAGLELLDPGVVPIQDWRPDSLHDIHSAPTAMWGGVARKPLPDPLPLSRWPRMSRGCAASSSARRGLQITVIFRASRESWAHGHHGGARGARAAASVDGVPRGTYDLI